MNDVKIHDIARSELSSYLYYVPRDEIEDILSGEHRAIGIDDDSGNAIGAIIAENATEPDGGAGRILVSRKLYTSEEYRDEEVLGRIVRSLGDYARADGCTGVVFRTLFPDEGELESVLKKRFERLEDGNTIFEADATRFLYSPVIKKKFGKIDGRIVKFSSFPPDEREYFFEKRRDRFPEGLTPGHLPGKWLPELSFVCRDAEDYVGYILSSELSEDMIYVGALYVAGNEGLEAAALIGRVGRTVLEKALYDRVMFSAATAEGRKLCEYLTNGMKGVKRREVHNYYFGTQNY